MILVIRDGVILMVLLIGMQGAAMASPEDLGTQIAADVYQLMQIDDEWARWEDRGFTWWGHRLPQRVWAEPLRQSYGVEIAVTRAETSLLRNVADSPDLHALLARWNHGARTSAYVYDPNSKRVFLHCSVVAHDQIAPLMKGLFTHAVAMQIATAHEVVEDLRRAGEVIRLSMIDIQRQRVTDYRTFWNIWRFPKLRSGKWHTLPTSRHRRFGERYFALKSVSETGYT